MKNKLKWKLLIVYVSKIIKAHSFWKKRVKFVQKPGHEDALYIKFVFLKKVSINICDTVH